MRTFHEALEAVETYSPAEEQFNNRRRTVGLFLGPLLLVALIALPLPVPLAAHKLAGVLAMMVVFWVTEALPLAVTAMLGPVLAVILRIVPVRAAFASFADPVIFVFIGGFILAEAMFVHEVDQRIAYTALSQRFVGTSANCRAPAVPPRARCAHIDSPMGYIIAVVAVLLIHIDSSIVTPPKTSMIRVALAPTKRCVSAV